jgi:MoxR-like ATPase
MGPSPETTTPVGDTSQVTEPERETIGVEHLEEAVEIGTRLLDNIERVLRGKRNEIKLVLAALACHGHVLFEDVPGTGKTVLARAIARSIEDTAFARIQCTPDLQPSDVTGVNIYDQKLRDFEFRRGPLFANVVLVDEINRAMPKTQSALLEAMAERQVTIDGHTYVLPQPFLVLATENPIEFEGVFPLPEAQLDRFFLKARLGYPGEEDELAIVLDQHEGHPLDRLRPVVTAAEMDHLERSLGDVYLDDLVRRWTIALVRVTRDLPEVSIGASVRGSLALERAARAWALLDGRGYATPEDVERMFGPVLGHRIVFSPSFIAESRGRSREEILLEMYGRCTQVAPPPELADVGGVTRGPRWTAPST